MVLSTTNPPVDTGVQKTPVKKKKATTKQVSTARNATVLAMEEALTTPPPSSSKRFSQAEDVFLCRAFCSNVSSLDMAIEIKQKAEDRAKQISIKQLNTLMKLSLMWKDKGNMEKANHYLQLASDFADFHHGLKK